MKHYNLIVVGGGLSGVAAAVSAARQGLSVLIAEKSGSFGGAIHNSLVYPFMKFFTTVDDRKKYLSAGLFSEMRSRQESYIPSPTECRFVPEYLKIALDDMVTESGAEILFHATLFAAKTDGRAIRSVCFAVKSGILEVEADFFVDATGDGDLMAFSGCQFQLGREEDNLCQPMTTCFRVGGVDETAMREEWQQIQELYREKKASGEIRNPREDILKFGGLGQGIVHFNTTRIIKLDPTDPADLSRGEITGRKQIAEMMKFLKENTRAFRDCFLISCASEIGVRESRMLRGEHILTAQELTDCIRFPDAIALGNYDIDIHNPEGEGTSHRFFAPGEYYTIPYASLLPRELDNLLVAGRCISVTHEAQASIRIMPICATLGEAAGTAIAVSFRDGKNTHTVDVQKIRSTLRDNGAAVD